MLFSSTIVEETVIIRNIAANANKPGTMKSNWLNLLAAIKLDEPRLIGVATAELAPNKVVMMIWFITGGMADVAIKEPLST